LTLTQKLKLHILPLHEMLLNYSALAQKFNQGRAKCPEIHRNYEVLIVHLAGNTSTPE